jgi:hypothetical protein
MSELEGTAVLVALFALRCILPIVITLAFGYLMNHLVDRWQQEDSVADANGAETEPFDGKIPGVRLPAITMPCWILKNCEEAERAVCAAYKQPGLPCWMARLRTEGVLPADCPNCPIYAKAMTPALR